MKFLDAEERRSEWINGVNKAIQQVEGCDATARYVTHLETDGGLEMGKAAEEVGREPAL